MNVVVFIRRNGVTGKLKYIKKLLKSRQ